MDPSDDDDQETYQMYKNKKVHERAFDPESRSSHLQKKRLTNLRAKNLH